MSYIIDAFLKGYAIGSDMYERELKAKLGELVAKMEESPTDELLGEATDTLAEIERRGGDGDGFFSSVLSVFRRRAAGQNEANQTSEAVGLPSVRASTRTPQAPQAPQAPPAATGAAADVATESDSVDPSKDFLLGIFGGTNGLRAKVRTASGEVIDLSPGANFNGLLFVGGDRQTATFERNGQQYRVGVGQPLSGLATQTPPPAQPAPPAGLPREAPQGAMGAQGAVTPGNVPMRQGQSQAPQSPIVQDPLKQPQGVPTPGVVWYPRTRAN
jgi:hypothetical protein